MEEAKMMLKVAPQYHLNELHIYYWLRNICLPKDWLKVSQCIMDHIANIPTAKLREMSFIKSYIIMVGDDRK